MLVELNRLSVMPARLDPAQLQDRKNQRSPSRSMMHRRSASLNWKNSLDQLLIGHNLIEARRKGRQASLSDRSPRKRSRRHIARGIALLTVLLLQSAAYRLFFFSLYVLCLSSRRG
jgi:hypothetical protein